MGISTSKLLRESLLSEGASSIIYHFTYLDRLIGMLSSDKLLLTNSIGTKADQTGDKMYYASFSRSRSTKHGYGSKMNRPSGVRIKVDGSKLGAIGKIKPIDYWQYPRTPDLMGGSGDEMEDRFVSNSDEIKNFSRYIISVDVFMGDKGVPEELLKLADELNVKVNYFTNERDFASGLEARGVEPIINNEGELEYKSNHFYDIGVILGATTYKDPQLHEQVVNLLSNQLDGEHLEYVKKSISELHTKYDTYVRDDDYYLVDQANSLSALIHNNKSNKDELVRLAMREFVKLYKKMGATSIKDFLLKKYYIGKKSKTELNKEFYAKIKTELEKSTNEVLDSYLNYDVYNQDGEQVNLIKYQPLIEYINGKLGEMLKVIGDYILTNDDLYKYSYVLAPNEVLSKVDLSGLADVLAPFDSEEPKYLGGLFKAILSDVDDVIHSEIPRIRDEFHSQ